MRTTTLKSYLYQQYADDDDLQGFVAAYNAATQTVIDWFNQIGLPYYPGLNGPLLDWVVAGLYGLQRTPLASPLTPAQGMLNTVPLNTLVLNGFVPSSQTFYNLTDDVFQRILTWDFYKGDGKRFSTRWLKRRIMRFIVGVNGVDPQPSQPGFVIGAESTLAVGVLIAGGVVTVSINQTLLTLLAQITPGILTLFKLAFEGGNLDLPVAYTYVVNIITGFNAIARPSIESSSGPALTQTTGVASVIALGGTGIYTYAWTWRNGASLVGAAAAAFSGGGALTTADRLAGAAAVGVSATGALNTPGPVSGAATVTVNAAGTLLTAIPLAGAAAAGVSASLASAAGLTIDFPTSANTSFTARDLTWGQTLTGVALCTVTDTVSGLTTTATVLVTITATSPQQILTEGGLAVLTETGSSIVVEP